jgi:7,8-dihydropterin-6-yl-methyl-4-(beta-D-ribofuranosyl)aminobenzene 5'-phosphate synthase
MDLRTNLFVAAALAAAVVLVTPTRIAAAEPTGQITIIYDAFGSDAAMKKDWGFSALVEISGKRILFDTGNDQDIFAANIKAKNIDLTSIDFVVLSHRHSDHMAGLNHVLSVNPTVKIYAPKEGSAFSARRCHRASTERTKPCRPRCATTAASRRRS